MTNQISHTGNQTDTARPDGAIVLAGPELQRAILRTIAKKHFCTLATTSPAGFPHSAGVVYDAVDGKLWIHTERTSRKARNIAANPRVGVCVVYRKLPVGPPFTIHFQATARIVAMDDSEARALLAAGELGGISGHGALDMPQGCFVCIEPIGSVHSFGPGASTLDLVRDPLHTGARSFRLAGSQGGTP